MAIKSTRRSLMGSYRFSVMVKPESTEFGDNMNGTIDLYDGKHVTQTQKYTSFDQLATIIMNYWEKALGTDVNIHRFSNWLSEYFTDIGMVNINFYQMIETVRDIGKGVMLQSSGHTIREAKVRAEDMPITVEDRRTEIKQESFSESLERKVGLSEEKTPERVVKLTPAPKKVTDKKEEQEPPSDKLLRPTQILKKKDITVVIDEDYVPTFATIAGDPIITKPEPKTEKISIPPSDTLLRPSNYLKKRDTIDVISSSLRKPSALPAETKIESVKTESVSPIEPEQKKMIPPSESLLRPSDYLKKSSTAEIKPSHHLVKPSEILKEQEEVLKEVVPPKIDPEIRKIPKPEIKAERKAIDPSVEKKPVETLPFEIELLDDEEEIPSPIVMKPPITDITGVGEKTAMLLKEGGYATVDQILKASPEELSKIPGISLAGAKKLIHETQILDKEKAPSMKKPKITDIMGVGEKTAMLLKEGGYDTIDQILNSSPEKLSKIPGIGITTAKKLIYGAKAISKQKE